MSICLLTLRKYTHMKYTFILILLFCSSEIVAQQNDVIRLSEPVEETSNYEVFGNEMGDIDEESTLKLLDAIQLSGEENEIYIKTQISQVCMKKGCFFIANESDESARVTFKDYSFFIPTNSLNKEVIIRGVISAKELSEDQAKHFAEDAGEDASTVEGPVKEYSIVASSVLLFKTEN